MEVKILDNIIHGVLKPWQINTANKKRFTELVKAAKAASPGTGAELHTQLSSLLADYPVLQTVLSAEPSDTKPIQQLLFKSDLPKYNDAITQFYYYVITAETLRVFNSVLQQAANWTELVDIRYQVGKTLTNVRVLAKQTSIELIEQGFTTAPDEQSNLIHLALYWLKHSLIELYFSIQKTFETSLQQVTSQEDFYLLDLEEPFSNSLILEIVEPALSNGSETHTTTSDQVKFSFGFKGDDTKLKNVLVLLSQKINLLKEEKTTVDGMHSVLTSKDLKGNTTEIYLDCETAQFRYVIDKIASQFSNLKLKAIEKSELFFSNNGIKITSQNLSSSKVDQPKEYATIDNIMKQLQ